MLNNISMETKRKFGWIPQQPDIRDHKLPLRMVLLPKSADLRPQDPPIVDQDNLGACTANGIAGVYEFVHIKEGNGDFHPSRLDLYYKERVIEHSVKTDAGAIIRDGMKVIGKGDKAWGVCSEELWPYIIRKFKTKPCKKCYKDALKHLAVEYMAVDQTPDALKGCLADGYPFVFGFTVYENFMDIGSDGIMPMPKGNVDGGHCVVGVGYDDTKKRAIIRNSWGTGWGDKGYFYMPYDYLFNKDLCSDFWTLRLVQ
jgi:C1A family cysteine protease